MYIVDGIAYAGEPALAIKISGVRPLENHRLWLRFNTGEVKIFDVAPWLTEPAFLPLSDEQVFRNVYIDYGVVVWEDGNIDLSPELLYRDGVPTEDTAIA